MKKNIVRNIKSCIERIVRLITPRKPSKDRLTEQEAKTLEEDATVIKLEDKQ